MVVVIKCGGDAFLGVLVTATLGAVQYSVAGNDDLLFADGAVIEKAHGHGIVFAVTVQLRPTVSGFLAGLEGMMGAF